MKLTAITQPEPSKDEAAAITSLFDAGLEIPHLRKPGVSYEDMDRFLHRLSAGYMERIVTHDHFGLAFKRNLKGVHLNRHSPVTPASSTGHVGRSCHSLEGVAKYKAACSCVSLSPIHNSISEEGYATAYAFDGLQKAHRAGTVGSGVMALRGVTAEHSPEINSLGFGGVGLLDDIWQWTGAGFTNYFRELPRSASVF